jgi:hypothetical protein
VPLSHAAQAPQHLGYMRAEHPPVPVALVDDHDPQPSEEPAPAVMGRQHPAMEHVRICQ